MNASLSQPEYLHVLLNPLLTHALPLAALGLLVALICRSRAAVRLALVLVALAGASVWPVVHYGENGFDRVQAMADSAGSDWLAVHRHRAEEAEWLFYVTAAIAFLALTVPRKWPGSATPLALAALLAALAASTAAAWVAYPAGRVRHREFRHGPPPAAEVQAAEKEADGS